MAAPSRTPSLGVRALVDTQVPHTPALVDVVEDATLAAVCAELRQHAAVAVDTEFERTRTFYARPGLIQLSDGHTVWLVDPLAITDAAPLRELLASDTLKVMHACTEDVEVLAQWCGAVPAPVFDTQLAEAFLGGRYGVGYRDLVAAYLHLDLAKGETRSDWLGRPLTQAQRAYAAQDVLWLPAIHAVQREALAADARAQWHAEDCRRLVAESRGPSPEDYYRSVRRAAGLRPRQLAAFAALTRWRERAARRLDRPRAWIARDEHLLEIAASLPRDAAALAAIEAVPRGLIRRWRSELLKAVRGALALPAQALPRPVPQPPSREEGKALKRLARVARERARELGLAEELLARKRLLEPLLRAEDGALPEPLTGWRRPLIGERLMALLAQERRRSQEGLQEGPPGRSQPPGEG